MLNIGLIDWFKRNNELHGWAMLALTVFVYMGQGGRGYISATMNWIVQYGFGEEPAVAQTATAIGRLPWNFKFLIGLISDNLPLFGYNVKIWLILAALFGLGGQVMLAFPELSPNTAALTTAFIIVQFYGATADCLADALVVKNGRNDEEDSSSGLQSLSWFSLGLGGGVFTLVGSQMSTDESQESGVNIQGSRDYNKIMALFPIGLIIFMLFLKEAKTDMRPSLRTLLQQLVRVFVALFSPPFLVLRVAIWIVLSQASALILGAPMVAFITSELEIPPSIQGLIDIGAYAFLSLGVIVYYKWFRYTSFRNIFILSQVFTAVIYMSDYVLVKRWNKVIGINDVWFMFASTAFAEVIGRLNAMPFLVMAGQLCPEHMEATFFALLMSISNQGSTAAEFLGATMTRSLGITRQDYSNLPTAILIRSAAAILVLAFVWLLPNTSALNPTNMDSLKPTNPYIIKLLKFADMYHPEKFEEEEKKEVKGDDTKV
jgi:hypothetical protein